MSAKRDHFSEMKRQRRGGQGCPRSNTSHELSQNLHRLAYFCIRIEEMRRRAQTHTWTAIDKDCSFRQSPDHSWTRFDIVHAAAAALVPGARAVQFRAPSSGN